MGDPPPADDQFPSWILFDRLKPLVAGLQDVRVVLRRTSSSTPEWTRPAVEQLVSLFRALRINLYDETGVVAAPPSDGEHYILLHGGEGAGREKDAAMYARLPPNRLVILVKSKRVLALESLSSKDHVRIKIDCRSQESMQEVARRIIVLLGARQVMAAPFDCVKWSESPEMVVVKKERNVSLGLSITTRQVNVSNYCSQIVLIKRIEKLDGKLEKLKRYMHIQSVNGILLDDLDCETASKRIRDISEGQVFLMVRAAHRDHNKAAVSPMTPLRDSPSLGPPPPPVWKGVCRFNANPFMLTWVQEAVPVVVQPNQVQLIPAFIMEPKEAPKKVVIVSYISCDVVVPQAADSRGHLVVGINDQSAADYQPALGKSPDVIMTMINRSKEKGVTLTLYLCRDGPKHLAEQTYSDYVTSLHGRRGPEEEEDLGIGEPEEHMLNPVIPSNHQYSPVYITGSSRSDSSHLFQIMTRGESTAVHPTPCSDYSDYSLTQSGLASAYDMPQKEEPLTLLETPSPANECNLFPTNEAGRRANVVLPLPIDSQLAPESSLSLVSPNSPVDLGRRSGSDSSSVASRRSTGSENSALYAPRPIPVLLSSQLFNWKWEPVSTVSLTTQDGHRCATPFCKYMLQNIDCKKLEEMKLSLSPSLELLYVKPNTICVYTINLEQLSTKAHEVFSEMCDFLSLFQSLRKPAGMQVILAAVYDSTTEYGKQLRTDRLKREWLFTKVPQALKSKFNEILHEDDKDCIEVVPVDLAECEGSAKRVQAAVSECVNRYYQRVEANDKDTEKMPLQQWPLFRQKVVELAYRYHVVSWTELAQRARQFLWIEEGELFERCLAALEQTTSLWVCHGAPGTKNTGFLVNPDIIISIISRLADSETFKKIRNNVGKGVADLLCSPSSATQSVLNLIMDMPPNIPASHLIQWMQTMGILFEGSGAATADPCYFIPSITSFAEWEDAHGTPLPDISTSCAELFIELQVPGTDTPPMPTHFFYQFVAHIISQVGIDAKTLSVTQGCTRVKISSLKLSGYLTPCEAVLSYDRLQCIIRIQLQPWQGSIIPRAHTYFRNVLKECEAKYGWKGMGRAIMGPAFRPASTSARCATLFGFLNEVLAEADPNSHPALFIVDADSLKKMSTKGIEPQLHIKNQDGSFRSHKVSEIVGLNQWIYDPTLLYENTEIDVNRMRAMNKVAEWLLQDPPLCALIACENGIISAQDPEAHTWSTNTGPVPAAYKLIQKWHACKLPISRLREALQRHHHNAAAKILLPFCDGMPQTEL